MREIDLSEFLVDAPPPKKKAEVVVLKLPPQHVWCSICHATGVRVRKETHTPELTEKAEELLTAYGKVLPVQQTLEHEEKCLRCLGAGHYFVPNDVRAKAVTMFWTRSVCRCGAEYEGPAHVNSCLIKNHVYRPVINEGKLYGWRYLETTYTPSQILPIYKTLPMSIEYFDYYLEVCRKCVREQMVICLPHVKESA